VSEYVSFHPDQLTVWSGNPRKTIDQSRLAELAASIKARGIDQPITVRVTPTGDVEIIAGQRRFLAAQIAGLHSIPCRVRDLTDEQALELAITENTARADVSPIEEAEAIEAYLRNHTIEQAADRFGRTAAWVQSRLRLLALIPYWRERVAADRCPIRHADLVSRLSPELQQSIAARYPATMDLPSSADFERAVQYFLQLLAHAPFDVNDASYPNGSCAGCSTRSDLQRDFFASATEANAACLNSVCWSAKVEHRWTLAQKDAKKRKLRILTADEVRFYGGGMAQHGEWIELERASKYKLAPTAIARDEDGLVVELVERAAYDRAASAALEALKKESAARKAAGKETEADRIESKREEAINRRQGEACARARRIFEVLRGARGREMLNRVAVDSVENAYFAPSIRLALDAPDGDSWAEIVSRMDDVDVGRLLAVTTMTELFDEDQLDELVAEFTEQSSEQADAITKLISKLAAQIDVCTSAAELGAAWAEIEFEDHRASLPDLARKWHERAVLLGLKPAAIKKMRKAGRAPEESLAA